MELNEAAEARSTAGGVAAPMNARVGTGQARSLGASAVAAPALQAGWVWPLAAVWAVCLAVGLVAGPAQAEAPAGERKRVAVLELAHAGPLADDVLRVSADLVRGAALKQLPRSAWQMMTRENIFELLPPGTDLSDCVADCEVETGRRLGAWLVVTGEVAQLGAALTVSLKAHRTDRGELVAQSVATAASTEGLWAAVQTAAADLFAQVAPPEGRDASRAPVPSTPVSAAAAESPAAAGAAEPAAPVVPTLRVAASVDAVPTELPDEPKRRVPTELPDEPKRRVPTELPDEPKRRVQGDPGPVGVDWVSLPGGPFTMGSDDATDDDDTDLDDGWANERPRRRVWVPGFELMKTEVTVAHYRACVEAGHCSLPDTGRACNWGQPTRENHPINCVDWAQASAFAQWVGGRLPSEAEWEFAARSGGRDQRYTWGDRPADQGVAVMKGALGTAPVCSKVGALSLQGVCDLAGNVSEWVADWYGPYPEAPSDGSARTQATQSRVSRGGGWRSTTYALRAASRDRNSPGTRSADLGFRVAR